MSEIDIKKLIKEAHNLTKVKRDKRIAEIVKTCSDNLIEKLRSTTDIESICICISTEFSITKELVDLEINSWLCSNGIERLITCYTYYGPSDEIVIKFKYVNL